MARDYFQMGQVLVQLRYYQQALDYLKKALGIHETLNDRVNIGADYCNIGLVFSSMKMNKEATEYLNTGLKILYEVKEKTGYRHPVIQLIEQEAERAGLVVGKVPTVIDFNSSTDSTANS
jgi:tetratricopeptide (TPR) repeat protein